MQHANPAFRPLLIVSIMILITDQVLKYVMLALLNLDTHGVIVVIPDYFRLVMVWNTGINFGLFSNAGIATRWILVVLAVFIVILLLRQVLSRTQSRSTGIFAGLLCGGAIGNAIDRVFYGAVVDYLNISCCGFTNPYAFNVADIAVFAGLLGLLYCWPRSV